MRTPSRLALPLLLVAALSACSSSSRSSATSAADDASPSGTSAAAASAAATAGATTSVRPSVRASAAATAAASRAGATGTTAPRTGTGTTRTSGVPGTAPGSYTYDSSGTVTVFGGTQDATGTETLTVTPLSGGSQHATTKGDHSTTEEQLVPRSTGVFLSSLRIATQLFDVTFQPSPVALLVPTPARTGATWSWTATSTDGRTTATQSSKVLRTETLVIGGQQVATVVVQTHLVLSGAVDYTADVTNWFAPSYRLLVKDHQVGHGQQGSLKYSNDITDVLRSVRPA